MNDRWRRTTRNWRARRGPRSAAPPSTAVVAEAVVDGVFEIRLANGARRNVLARSTLRRLEELVAHPPSGTRAILITSEAPDFCAGYDLLEAARGEPETLIAHEDNFTALRHSTIPIVAALQGNVIGGGLELALWSDVRVATPDARFAVPAAKLGLVYSEPGIRLVVDVLGESVARAMFLAGVVIDADAALARGVIVDIVGREQLRGRAWEIAAAIANWSALASSGNRRILDAVVGRSVEDTQALHAACFAPHGDLTVSIAEFAARRSGVANDSHAGNVAVDPHHAVDDDGGHPSA